MEQEFATTGKISSLPVPASELPIVQPPTQPQPQPQAVPAAPSAPSPAAQRGDAAAQPAAIPDVFDFETYIKNIPDYQAPDSIPDDEEEKEKKAEIQQLIDYIDRNSLLSSTRQTKKAEGKVWFITRWLDEWRVKRNVKRLSKDETQPPTIIDYSVSSEELRKAVETACECLQKISKGGKIQDIRFTFVPANEERQSFSGGIIHISRGACISDIIHEMAHAIEDAIPLVCTICINFLKSRVRESVREHKCQVKTLKEITGSKYEKGEFAFDGIFTKQDVYAGKIYIEGDYTDEAFIEAISKLNIEELLDKIDSTEILSTGIENLVTDPVGFKKRDAGYYNLICHLLKNNI